MKNLFLGSIALTIFSFSVILFQISCQKESEVQAQTSTTGATQLNKILFLKDNGIAAELWTANYDGTNQVKINITLPAGNIIPAEGGNGVLSPDGQTVFFHVEQLSPYKVHLYKCSINGSNVQKIVDASTSDQILISGAY